MAKLVPGVVPMNGCEIAANHFVDQLIKDGSRIDFVRASTESIDNHPQIHCLITDSMCSIFSILP